MIVTALAVSAVHLLLKLLPIGLCNGDVKFWYFLKFNTLGNLGKELDLQSTWISSGTQKEVAVEPKFAQF